MSMFSGLGNQISGFVSSKMGKGEAPPEGGEPPAQQEMMIDENGQEVPVQPQPAGAMGFAQGFLAKAAAAKDGMAQKAGALGGLQAPFGAGGEQVPPAEPVYNEQGEIIDPATGLPPVEGAQPGAMGFAAGLMMKAHSLKEGVAAKAGAVPLGQVGGLATGVMGQVQGIIPGMKKEEEVPDPAAMGQEGQEVYQDQQYYDQSQYQDQQYAEGQYVEQ